MRYATPGFASRTSLLLTIFSAFVLLFFAFSTNQEYYTFPAYLPLLMLTAAALARTEQQLSTGNFQLPTSSRSRAIIFAHAAESTSLQGSGVTRRSQNSGGSTGFECRKAFTPAA